MQDGVTDNRGERNKNLVVLLLVLIIVGLAAQTVFMYRMLSAPPTKQLIVVRSPSICPKIKKSVVLPVDSKYKDKKASLGKSLITDNDQIRIVNLDKILRDDIQLTSAGMGETDSQYTVLYKILGVEKKNISVQLESDYLLITVKVDKVLNSNKGQTTLNLMSCSSMHKALAIPKNVDKSKISSTFKNGELKIILPKINNIIK
jgi:hypothetical protein